MLSSRDARSLKCSPESFILVESGITSNMPQDCNNDLLGWQTFRFARLPPDCVGKAQNGVQPPNPPNLAGYDPSPYNELAH